MKLIVKALRKKFLIGKVRKNMLQKNQIHRILRYKLNIIGNKRNIIENTHNPATIIIIHTFQMTIFVLCQKPTAKHTYQIFKVPFPGKKNQFLKFEKF